MLSSAHNLKKRFYAGCQPRHPSERLKMCIRDRLDVYIDRSNDSQKVKILKKRFIQMIQQHMGSPVFEEFEACYNRKAALYLSLIHIFSG